MNDRNEYENNEVNIPSFVDEGTTTSSVDMSIFKMSDKELYDDNLEDDDLNDDYSPKKPKNKITAILIIMGVIIALLLAISIISIIGKSQAEAKVASLTAEVETLNAKATTDSASISKLKEEKKQLEEENKKLKEEATKKEEKEKETADETEDGETTYIVVYEDGVVVREKASASSDAIASLGKDDTFTGYDITTDADGNTWVECWDGYICMKLADGTVLVKVK